MKFSRKKAVFTSLACAAVVAGVLGAIYLVRDNERFSARQIIAECSGIPKNMKALCYTDHLNDLLDRRGLSAALNVVARAYTEDPDVSGFCHSNMHDLGKEAYRKFSKTEHIDFSTEASFCGYGFFHGFMVEMLAETGSLDEARTFCTTIGEEIGGEEAYAEGSCYHGIGHGVTDGTDPTLWGDAAKIAAPGLALCRLITQNSEFAMRCASGVFNSVALMYRDPEYRLDARGKPFALCSTSGYTSEEKRACFDQMNTLAAYLSGYDFIRALPYATSIKDPSDREIALRGLMGLVYAKPPNPSFAVSTGLCTRLPKADQEPCIQGLVNGFMEYGTPGLEYRDALSFCLSPEMPKSFSQMCVDQVVRYAEGVYSPAQQKAVCEEVPRSLVPESCSTVGSSGSDRPVQSQLRLIALTV